jgi:uncharacterized protein YqgC (DUF456 family)
MLLLLALLTGAVLGMRFKVFVLIPAIGLIVPAIVAAEMIRDKSVASLAVTAVLAGTFLQIGYLVGAVTRYITAAARAGRRHGTVMRLQRTL